MKLGVENLPQDAASMPLPTGSRKLSNSLESPVTRSGGLFNAEMPRVTWQIIGHVEHSMPCELEGCLQGYFYPLIKQVIELSVLFCSLMD